MDKIYVVRGTEQTGPFTESEIRAQLASGAINGDTKVWWEGLPEWSPLSGTPLGALAMRSPAAPVSAPPAPAPGAIAAPVPSSVNRTSILAIVSLVSSILGLLCWPSAIVFGTTGVITGHLARKEIKRNSMLSGAGLALAGLIIGYVGIAIFAVAVTIYSLAMVDAIRSSSPHASIQDSDTNSSGTNSAPASQ